MTKVNLAEKFAQFDEPWSPRIVGELNGQHVKLVKLRGEFLWHKHDHEDELSLVVHGQLRMEFRDHQVRREQGDLLIVPRGVEHLAHWAATLKRRALSAPVPPSSWSRTRIVTP